MFEAKKSLLSGGRIKYARSNKDTIIFNISDKNKHLKAYRLQFTQLGFISYSGAIYENKEPIYKLVNSQINQTAPYFRGVTTYNNTRNLIARYILRPALMNSSNNLFKYCVSALTGDGKHSANCHTIILKRHFKRGKASALAIHIKNLIDQGSDYE